MGREKEVDREILAFSVSHDDREVWICGHYPKVGAGSQEYYRHLIHAFSISAYDGKDKWTAYGFTENIYQTWAPSHLERICFAVNQLPQPQSVASSGTSQRSPPPPGGPRRAAAAWLRFLRCPNREQVGRWEAETDRVVVAFLAEGRGLGVSKGTGRKLAIHDESGSGGMPVFMGDIKYNNPVLTIPFPGPKLPSVFCEPAGYAVPTREFHRRWDEREASSRDE